MTRTAPSLTTLVLLTSLSVLSLNMFLPSLQQMADDFAVDYWVMSLALGGYLAVSAGLQMVLGPMSDKWGRRPVMLFGMGLFTFASVGCAVAGNVWVFLSFRVLQGAVGTGMVLSRAAIRDMAPQQEAARLLGIVGTAMALAPLLGPIAGGMLHEAFGWRSVFWVFALLGGAMVVITFVDMGETNNSPSARFSDQFRAYPPLLRSGLFWSYSACLVFSVGGFYAFLGGAPLVGDKVYSLSPAQLGIGMGVISGGFMLGNIVTTQMMGRVDGLRLMLWGRVMGGIGPLVALMLVLMGISNPYILFGGAIFVGFGNGLTLPMANAGVMSVDPRLAGSASGLSGAMTLAGGAAISALTGVRVAGAFGAQMLLLMLFLTGLGGLISALWVMRTERARELP